MDHEQPDADHGDQHCPLKRRSRKEWRHEALKLWVADPGLCRCLLLTLTGTALRWRLGYYEQILRLYRSLLVDMGLPPNAYTLTRLRMGLFDLKREDKTRARKTRQPL